MQYSHPGRKITACIFITPRPPEQASNANLAVWVSIHPTDSALATASEAITISYTTGGASADTATAGSDYTAAPANSTVTIPAGASYASFNIPILTDSDDEGNETFTVSLTDATTTDSKVISIADSSATATIGDPDISSIYFYPNRPLMQGDGTTTNKGDRVYFDCYVQASAGSPFALSFGYISFNGGGVYSRNDINANAKIFSLPDTAGDSTRDLRNYIADAATTLLGPASSAAAYTRSAVRVTIQNTGAVTYSMNARVPGLHTYTGYQQADVGLPYGCHGISADASVSSALITGSFGQKAYGQAY